MFSQNQQKPKDNKAVANWNTRLSNNAGFVDNRPKHSVALTNRNGTMNTVQRKVTTTEVGAGPGGVHLYTCGYANEFSDGENPGGYGYNGVERYYARYNMRNTGIRNLSPYIPNHYIMAHQGHALAKYNGGKGNNTNIFAQDGGANTTGSWPKFEKQMRADLDSVDPHEWVTFEMFLEGRGITNGPIIQQGYADIPYSPSQEEYMNGGR